MLLHTVWIAQLIHFQDSAAPCNLQWCSHPICDLNSGNNIEVSVLQDDLKKKILLFAAVTFCCSSENGKQEESWRQGLSYQHCIAAIH